MISIKFNKVYYNKKLIGLVERQDDGYFQFHIAFGMIGYWRSDILRLIADKLDRLNERLDNHIKEYFKNDK